MFQRFDEIYTNRHDYARKSLIVGGTKNGGTPWARSTYPLSFGERGGRTKSLISRLWHSSSKIASNSEPPSTCIALTGKGSLLET